MKNMDIINSINCNWEGSDLELEDGYHNSYIGANDELLCPNCKMKLINERL